MRAWLGDSRPQQRFVVCALTRRTQACPLGDEPRDGALGVENALPLHFGGMRGEHGRDMRMRQRTHQHRLWHPRLSQARKRRGKRADRRRRTTLALAVGAYLLLVFADVDEKSRKTPGSR